MISETCWKTGPGTITFSNTYQRTENPGERADAQRAAWPGARRWGISAAIQWRGQGAVLRHCGSRTNGRLLVAS